MKNDSHALLASHAESHGLALRFAWRLLPWFVAALAVLVAVRNRDVVNTDAVAYLRLASYWAEGKWSLAVSGYWGPLLPWIVAIFLKSGVEPLLAGHLAMAVSAVLFWWGGTALIRQTRVDGWIELGAGAVVGLAAVTWSAEIISPDLLMGGCVLAAMSVMMREAWGQEAKEGWLAGVFWALAYYAKAIAFPLAIVVVPVVAWMRRYAAREAAAFMGSGAVCVALFLSMSAPWIGVLTWKYGHLTFSTTGRIAHAIVGPPDVERYHPFGRTLHVPEPGRVTAWEDPSLMDYPYWSPWSSRANFEHQIKVLVENGRTILRLLWNLDQLGLGLAAAGLAFIWVVTRRETLPNAWRWIIPVAPIVVLVGGYAATYVKAVDERYFFAALPLLLGVALGALHYGRTSYVSRLPMGGKWVAWVVMMSFLLPAMQRMPVVLEGLPAGPAGVSRMLAANMQKAGVTGPLAGSAFLGAQRTGLLTAYFLGVPWHGDSPKRLGAFLTNHSGAIVIMVRGSPEAKALSETAACVSLDARLFKSAEDAAEFPLQAFGNSLP